jgi:hypothetical protein
MISIAEDKKDVVEDILNKRSAFDGAERLR